MVCRARLDRMYQLLGRCRRRHLALGRRLGLVPDRVLDQGLAVLESSPAFLHPRASPPRTAPTLREPSCRGRGRGSQLSNKRCASFRQRCTTHHGRWRRSLLAEAGKCLGRSAAARTGVLSQHGRRRYGVRAEKRPPLGGYGDYGDPGLAASTASGCDGANDLLLLSMVVLRN